VEVNRIKKPLGRDSYDLKLQKKNRPKAAFLDLEGKIQT
jgi:hypothetical protein